MADSPREERLKALREQLYSRATPPRPTGRKGLQKPTRPAVPSGRLAEKPHIPAVPPQPASPPRADGPPADSMSKNRRAHYRKRFVAAGVVFFVVALILSSVFLFFGQNTISGSNIVVDVDGPFAIGGGEELSFRVAIANENAVPVESATLVVEYPSGTQSADESGKELFRERLALETINSGEILNIPLRARVFGEENEEKVVSVSVEYRVRGSNATFYKEADPLRFRISSSPVVLSAVAVDEITSGQEFEVELTVASNSKVSLSDVIVKAEYPDGFDFSEASPSPISGQDTWRIDTLEPESEETIRITGVLIGSEEDEKIFNFSSGVANDQNAFALSSVFSTASFEVQLKEGFFDVMVSINGSDTDVVAVGSERSADVSISFVNTLPYTIYDAEIDATLSGSGFEDESVSNSQGFYDSTSDTVRWTSQEVASLRDVAPGDRNEVSFSLSRAEGANGRTPEIRISVSLRGKRVAENRVPEALVNQVTRTVRFESAADLSSKALYTTGPFVNTGPIPPKAEEVTQYTLALTIDNGGNDITDAEVTAALPSYITWLDLTSGDGTVSFNTSERTVTWRAGDVDALDREEVFFQVGFLPSTSQVGNVPTILGVQNLRAVDRFTGTVVRDSASALTTRLTEDSGAVNDGRVQPKD